MTSNFIHFCYLLPQIMMSMTMCKGIIVLYWEFFHHSICKHNEIVYNQLATMHADLAISTPKAAMPGHSIPFRSLPRSTL